MEWWSLSPRLLSFSLTLCPACGCCQISGSSGMDPGVCYSGSLPGAFSMLSALTSHHLLPKDVLFTGHLCCSCGPHCCHTSQQICYLSWAPHESWDLLSVAAAVFLYLKQFCLSWGIFSSCCPSSLPGNDKAIQTLSWTQSTPARIAIGVMERVELLLWFLHPNGCLELWVLPFWISFLLLLPGMWHLKAQVLGCLLRLGWSFWFLDL